MNDFKQDKEKLLPYDDHRDEMQRRIKKLNQKYDKHGLRISILTKGHHPHLQKRYILLANKDSNEVGNFFFYPTHKIYEYDGKEKKHFGFKICFVTSISKITGTIDTYFKIISLNISNEILENGKWLKSKELKGFELKKKSVDIEKLMKTMLNGNWEKPEKELIFSSVIGWVKARSNFQYVPITNSDKNGVKSTKDIDQNFKHEILEEMSEKEAYLKMKELLSVTKKEITISLLSFTVISSLQSLIKQYSDEAFMLCLCSDNERHAEMLSNLFCNIYNRTSHFYKLDTKLHADQSLKTDIPTKIEKIRDAVFISKVVNRNDLKTYTKLLNNVSCGLLLISSIPLKHDSVIDFDISGTLIDKSIVQYHQDYPAAFSTWFHYFVSYIQDSLEGEHWGRELNNLYKDCKKRIEKYNPVEFDPNKLRQCAWLLTGFRLFENFGREIEAINEEEFQSSLNEAIVIFHKLSAIDIGDEQYEREISTDLKPLNLLSSTDIIETDALTFINFIDKHLSFDGLNKFEEKSANPEWGWYDKEKLYLRNTEIFKKVTKLYKLKSKRSEIYDFLLTKEILTDRGEMGWGSQFKGSTKTINYNIQSMRKFLQDHGIELKFLNKYAKRKVRSYPAQKKKKIEDTNLQVVGIVQESDVMHEQELKAKE